jgi:histidinol phosphatase-like enzyme (inositol monophosphatase family)
MAVSPDFLRQLAAAAAAETLPRFRAHGNVENKKTCGFDPVTEADRGAEMAIRAIIRETFPEHGIIGEEFGVENPDAENVWVIDPIDGTRAFITGLPVWGTLAGLVTGGRAVAGFMSQPFTGEFYFSDGNSSHYEGRDGASRIWTRKTRNLADATILTTTPALYAGEKREQYDRLERACRLARYGTDCYAFAMLASGFADVVCETGLNSYDIVALIPIIEQAGGLVTTWDGGRAENGGDVLAAATSELHEKALKTING